jgi:predicted acylesterase/phospholipase RssA
MPDPSLYASEGTEPRRSLILAGGGMRVAYQAGVLKALAEFGYKFAHGDGASGGTMNLAMLLSGLTPDQMCDRWRTLDVHKFSSAMPLGQYSHAWNMAGMASSEGIRNAVFPHLGIDIPAINRSTAMAATFNVCNFSRKVADVITAPQLTVDLLVAGISLPIFMPAVRIDADWYTDAVWIKDANLMTAVAQGSEELWLVWCIGNTPEYLSGAFNQYVHMIEMAGNGRLFEEFKQISSQRTAPPVKLHIIKPAYPLPLDPDFFLGRISASTLIEMGYSDTYRYIESEMTASGVPLTPEATRMKPLGVGITFNKTLRCDINIANHRSRALTLHLTIRILNLTGLLQNDPHALQITGNISHATLGNLTPLIHAAIAPSGTAGHFNLICRFRSEGSEHRLEGDIKSTRGALPVGISKLPFSLSRVNHGVAESVGTGILTLGYAGFLETIRTFHVTSAPTFRDRIRAWFRFCHFYCRGLME